MQRVGRNYDARVLIARFRLRSIAVLLTTGSMRTMIAASALQGQLLFDWLCMRMVQAAAGQDMDQQSDSGDDGSKLGHSRAEEPRGDGIKELLARNCPKSTSQPIR